MKETRIRYTKNLFCSDLKKEFGLSEFIFYENLDSRHQTTYKNFVRREGFAMSPSLWFEKRARSSIGENRRNEGVLTFQEIGKIMGFSEQRAKQIYQNAIEKIKKNKNLKELLEA